MTQLADTLSILLQDADGAKSQLAVSTPAATDVIPDPTVLDIINEANRSTESMDASLEPIVLVFADGRATDRAEWLASYPITETPITETPITETSITETPITESPITETPVQITERFITNCNRLTPTSDLIQFAIENKDSLCIKYKNYALIRAVARHGDPKLITFFIENGMVTPKMLERACIILCAGAEPDAAVLILNLKTESDTFIVTRPLFTSHMELLALSHVAMVGDTKLIHRLRISHRGMIAVDEVSYALRGALSGLNTPLIHSMLEEFAELAIFAPSNEYDRRSIKCYARSFVVYASKINEPVIFEKILTAVNPLCRWSSRSNAYGRYWGMSIDRPYVGIFKRGAPIAILNSCLRHDSSIMANLFISQMAKKINPILSIYDRLVSACESDNIENIKAILSIPDLSQSGLRKALLVCKTDEAAKLILERGGPNIISMNNIEELRKATNPLVREYMAAYLSKLVTEFADPIESESRLSVSSVLRSPSSHLS